MTEQPKVPVRVVVCAANRSNAGNVVLGARHHDKIMNDTIYAIFEDSAYGMKWEQGFIDQWGVFMDRKEALLVATAAGQIGVRRPKGNPADMLFSEDLY